MPGKQIKKITPEEAKAINEKDSKHREAESKETQDDKQYKGVFFKSKHKQVQAENKSKETDKSKDKNNKRPLLSFENLFKAIGVAIVAGYAVKGLRTNAGVEKVIKAVSDKYNALYKKITVKNDVQLGVTKFEEILSKLRKSGFEDIAKKYETIVKESNLISKDGKSINLGDKNKTFVKPLVDFITGPISFSWSILKAPYYWTNKAIGAITKTLPKAPEKVTTELGSFKQSIDCIGKEALKKNFKADKFADFVEVNSLKGFNEDNVSGISNSDLSNIAKTGVFAATLPFLMSDNYNMVMVKSNGEDKENAELKYKERLVQESSRFFYSTLLISLFNNAFQSQYHKSLFGMSWITAACTIVGETLNRKSIGVPVGTYTRDEISQMQHDRENASPLAKSYYDFMAKLTGKKSLEEQRQIKDEKKTKA